MLYGTFLHASYDGNVAAMEFYDDHVHDDVVGQITHNALRGLNTFIPTPSPSSFEMVHYQTLEINSCSMVTSVACN